jgi:hypothetical protein
LLPTGAPIGYTTSQVQPYLPSISEDDKTNRQIFPTARMLKPHRRATLLLASHSVKLMKWPNDNHSSSGILKGIHLSRYVQLSEAEGSTQPAFNNHHRHGLSQGEVTAQCSRLVYLILAEPARVLALGLSLFEIHQRQRGGT